MNFRKDLVIRYLKTSANRLEMTTEHLISQAEQIDSYLELKGFKDKPPQYTEFEISVLMNYISILEVQLNTVQNLLSDSKIIEYSRNSDSTA